jgi:DNA-binding protein Fis
LAASGGNLAKTAQMLDLTRHALRHQMLKAGLLQPDAPDEDA